MGIIIDIILIAILILSAFLGYKKGLIKLATGLFAGILAILLTLVLYKPVATLIIDKTQLDENLQTIIVQKTQNVINQNIEPNNEITEDINNMSNNLVEKKAEEVSINIIYVLTGIVLFIFSKIIIRIIISFLDLVAKLPILKQFNQIGGIIYGLLRGILIIFICVILMTVYSNLQSNGKFKEGIDNSYITKIISTNIVKI